MVFSVQLLIRIYCIGVIFNKNNMLNIYNVFLLSFCFTHERKDKMDLVKCTLVSMVHIMFYTLEKGYRGPGNQDTHDKLKQNR